jgi:uncharacterized protein
MASLSGDMKRVVLEQKLGFAATVCPDGTPNLSPKGTTTVWDDAHLLFADISSPQTVRNLADNPSIEINVVDPVVRKGYRFKGRASLHGDGETFERGLALLRERGYDARRERVRTIVLVAVEHAGPLTSPAYDGGAREDRIAAQRGPNRGQMGAILQRARPTAACTIALRKRQGSNMSPDARGRRMRPLVIRGKDRNVFVRRGAEELEHRCARSLDQLGHRRGRRAQRVRVAKDALAQELEVLVEHRVGVEAGAGVVEVDVAACVEAGEVAAP